MKQILAAAAALLLSGPLSAQITNLVTVAWDRNPEPDEPEFIYTIYYGPTGTTETNVLAVGNAIQGSITNLAWSTEFWFYVTAKNAVGLESDPSTVLTYTVPEEPTIPAAPAAVSIELRILSANQVLGPFTNELAVLKYRHALPMELFAAEVSSITVDSNTPAPLALPPTPGAP